MFQLEFVSLFGPDVVISACAEQSLYVSLPQKQFADTQRTYETSPPVLSHSVAVSLPTAASVEEPSSSSTSLAFEFSLRSFAPYTGLTRDSIPAILHRSFAVNSRSLLPLQKKMAADGNMGRL